MTQDEIIAWLERALKDAEHMDDWHRYGEGYTELRTDVQNLVRKLREEQK